MKKIKGMLLIACLILSLAVAVRAAVQTFDLTWWTVDGGGADSQGGSYRLSATIGQVDAGTLRGGSYSLAGGFWSAGPSAPVAIEYKILMPLVIK